MRSQKERVMRVIAEQLGMPTDLVSPKDFIDRDLGADSLDCIELVIAFEDEFGIEIPDEAIAVAEGKEP